jgi:hypothetical protein
MHIYNKIRRLLRHSLGELYRVLKTNVIVPYCCISFEQFVLSVLVVVDWFCLLSTNWLKSSFETSVRNYCTLRNNPEERRCDLLRGRSLRSRSSSQVTKIASAFYLGYAREEIRRAFCRFRCLRGLSRPYVKGQTSRVLHVDTFV